jgi:hypothetical protein
MRKVLYVAALVAAVMIATELPSLPAAAFAADSTSPEKIGDKRLPPPVELAENVDSSSRDALPREAGARPTDPMRPLAVTPAYARPVVSSRTCASGEVDRRDCGEQWRPLLRQSFQFLLIQHSMNLAMDQSMRYEISHGHWFDKWMTSVSNQHFSHWNDQDSFLTDYIGHPMMGAVTDFMYIQNDPSGRDLMIGKNRAYWMSRLRAMGFSAAYSAQWEIGPMSEASIGNTGKVVYFSKASHSMSNGTGAVDFVMTPIAGTVWSVGEDLIDRQIIWRLEGHTNNRLALLGMSVLNPNRSVANVMRGKAPWYRDFRPTRVPTKMLPFQK